MAVYYVDLSAGSNGNAGSESAPFRDFTPINAGLWDGNEVRVKRGSSGVVNSASRANVNAPNGCVVTAYGDAASPLPVISGGGTNFFPVWLQNGAGIIVDQLHVTQAPASGIMVAPVAGSSLDDITVRDVLVTENTQNSAMWGSDGLTVGGFPQEDAGPVSNVLLERITARDNGGHGFKVRGQATNVRVLDSVSIRSGLRTPSHAFGTAGNFVALDATTTGAYDIRTGWTNISGNVWEHALSAPGVMSSITAWSGVWVLGAGPTYYKLPYSATPATPGPGECGIGAANTVRINLNGVVAPTALVHLWGVFAHPENVAFRNCVGAYTVDGVTQIEGQGVYFDNGSVKCYSYNCVAIGNEGQGGFMNDCTESAHFGLYAYDNGRACVGIARGVNTNVFGSTLIARPGTRGIEYLAGNVQGKARRNQIVGATVGIWGNDSASNQIIEDENIFIDCTTRLTQVSSAGARSIDRVSSANRTPNVRGAWAMARIAAAQAAS